MTYFLCLWEPATSADSRIIHLLPCLFSSVTDHSSGVSYAAHLGGLAIAFVYLRLPHLRFDGMSLNRRYEKWRIDRAKRKFQVYMRKQDSKREPWIH